MISQKPLAWPPLRPASTAARGPHAATPSRAPRPRVLRLSTRSAFTGFLLPPAPLPRPCSGASSEFGARYFLQTSVGLCSAPASLGTERSFREKSREAQGFPGEARVSQAFLSPLTPSPRHKAQAQEEAAGCPSPSSQPVPSASVS